MQNIVIDKPYRFVPPRTNRFWSKLFNPLLKPFLRKKHGLGSIQFEGLENLRASLKAGHGVLLTPNHSRPCDPMVIGLLSAELGVPFYTMASWHLFMQSRAQTWLLTHVGAFSVYREGMDSAAVKEAIAILREPRGPLVIFPEGIISRANESLQRLNDGVAFMARTAARQNQKGGGRPVVIHPVALHYRFGGDLRASVTPVLDMIETRLTWPVRTGVPIRERLVAIGEALTALKELQILKTTQTGTLAERVARLVNQILEPIEAEWKVPRRDLDVPNRVRALRTAILPDLTEGSLDEEERARRWRELSDLYLAQQLFLYPPDYIASRPTAERILETVERFEEDLTDEVRIHRPMSVHLRIGPAISVSPDKLPSPDPLLGEIRTSLEAMILDLGKDIPLYQEPV